MGKSQMHEQILHMSRLGHRSLEKLAPCRDIIKQLTHKKCSAVRRPGLLHGYF